jgi:hypothetical protein
VAVTAAESSRLVLPTTLGPLVHGAALAPALLPMTGEQSGSVELRLCAEAVTSVASPPKMIAAPATLARSTNPSRARAGDVAAR